jgi:glutamate synthase (ferredoxin)
MIERHAQYTNSQRAKDVLADWSAMLSKFVKVLPNDYKRVIDAQREMLAKGMPEEEAAMAAFEANARSTARAGGR